MMAQERTKDVLEEMCQERKTMQVSTICVFLESGYVNGSGFHDGCVRRRVRYQSMFMAHLGPEGVGMPWALWSMV